MSSKAVVPSYVGILVLWCQSNQLGGVESLEESPQLVKGTDKHNVGVHVDQRIHICQQGLQQAPTELQLYKQAPPCVIAQKIMVHLDVCTRVYKVLFPEVVPEVTNIFLQN